MNKLILSVFMLLAVSKSNGQKLKDTYLLNPYPTTSVYTGKSIFFVDTTQKANYIFSFQRDSHLSAYNKFGSDTLYIVDPVLYFYNNKIRYIKIGNKVYPLKTN